jgi:hypothetical protein
MWEYDGKSKPASEWPGLFKIFLEKGRYAIKTFFWFLCPEVADFTASSYKFYGKEMRN